MVDLLAPTVGELIQQLMPWLSHSFVSPVASRSPSPAPQPKHEPVPPPREPSRPSPSQAAKDHVRPIFAPPPRSSTPVTAVYDYGDADGPVNTFNFTYEVLKTYGIEVARDYIALPDDAYVRADPAHPTWLEFLFDDDSKIFTLLFQVPVTTFMPPPDRGTLCPCWDTNQTIALTSFLKYSKYEPA